jgi:hypothetical protein
MEAGPFESHTIAGRRFTCDGDDDAVLQMNGKKNELKPNGDGTNRVTQSRVPGVLEGSNIIFDPEAGDVEFLEDVKNKGKFVDYSGTTNDGVIYSGSVVITGELKFSFKNGTVPVTLSGTFEKQG